MTDITPSPASKKQKVEKTKIGYSIFENTPTTIKEELSQYLENKDFASISSTSNFNAKSFKNKMKQRLLKRQKEIDQEIVAFLNQPPKFFAEKAEKEHKLVTKILKTPESKRWKHLGKLYQLEGENAHSRLLEKDEIPLFTYKEIKALLSKVIQSRHMAEILVNLIKYTPQLTAKQRQKLFTKYLFKEIENGELLFF